MFVKGDIVVAKEEFLDKGETVKDTLGVVLDYNKSNDYLLLGVLHPKQYGIAPTFSMRGCFYRKVNDGEFEGR